RLTPRARPTAAALPRYFSNSGKTLATLSPFLDVAFVALCASPLESAMIASGAAMCCLPAILSRPSAAFLAALLPPPVGPVARRHQDVEVSRLAVADAGCPFGDNNDDVVVGRRLHHPVFQRRDGADELPQSRPGNHLPVEVDDLLSGRIGPVIQRYQHGSYDAIDQ